MKTMILSTLAFTLTSMPVLAVDEHRELGPHVHGHGILNIAVEKNRLSMDLDVPGMDIVGFEHKPQSADQKATAENAEKRLADALVLFKVPESAGCKVADTKVSIEAEGAHDENAGKNEPTADAKHAGPKPGEDHAEHDGHSDYNVSYVLDCAKPSAITSIQFDYFKSFEGANALTVNIASDKSQNSYEVTREKPVLDLGGTM